MLDVSLLRVLSGIAPSEAEIESARANRDYEDGGIVELETKRSIPLPPAKTEAELVALTSEEARLKVVEFEVTSESVYKRKYIRPEKPGADSGITIGIGYDLGYNTAAQIEEDLKGLVSDADLQRLKNVSGLTRGHAANALPSVSDICLPWENAITLFNRSTVPRFVQIVRSTFPNADELHPHSLGALFSLVYNRGASLSGTRRRHMAAIFDLMKEREFAKIPAQISDMKELWRGRADCVGLLKRRDVEALLFQKGLDEAINSAQVATAKAATPDGGGQLEAARRPEDYRWLEGDGYDYVEADEDGRELESYDPDWQKASWAPDDVSVDYRHIADRSLSGKTFEFGPRELELLFEANSFKPARDQGRIIFALRGAQLVTSLTNPAPMDRQENREALVLREQRPNHKELRCVIGVYNVASGRMFGYPASTVPNGKAIATYVGGGSGSNMMMTGCYSFTVGWHQPGKPEKKIPGCLIEDARQKAVFRSKFNYTFDVNDAVDNSAPMGDNLHPGKSEGPFPFSSWGCLVVSGSVDPLKGGNRTNLEHIGEWGRFRKALGLAPRGDSDHGKVFDVVLLTGLEAAIASNAIARPADRLQEKLVRLRQGSMGPHVALLRQKLGLPASDVFDHLTVKAFSDKQREAGKGGADAIYSRDTDPLGVFSDATIVSAQLERRHAGGAHDQHDELAYELGLYGRSGAGSGDGDNLESLTSTIREYGTAALVAAGSVMMREAEVILRSYVCQCDAAGRLIDRDAVRAQIDSVAELSLGAVKHLLISGLRVASFSQVPPTLIERMVDYILDQLVATNPGSAGAMVIKRIDGGIGWLCEEWDKRLQSVYGIMPGPRAPSAQPGPRPDAKPNPAKADGPPESGDAEPPASDKGSAPQGPASGRVTELLRLMETAAMAETPDPAGVRTYIRHLHEAAKQAPLSQDDSRWFLRILCESRFLEQLSGSLGIDTYEVMQSLEEATKTTEAGKESDKDGGKDALNRHMETLLGLLGDARITVQAERAVSTLKSLKSARYYDELSKLADRFACRDPAVFSSTASYYAQGLIDSGRLLAGIEIIKKALQEKNLTPKDEAELKGLLGRANKQVYVNHIHSPSDAAAVGAKFNEHLVEAVAQYKSMFNEAKPAENYWHGVNYVALLALAAKDKVDLGQKHPTAEDVAKKIVGALETASQSKLDDIWLHASLGEAALAAGNIDAAAEHYAIFANHPNTDFFALNSALRQLQQVWRVEGATSGPGAIVMNLKSVLAQKQNGRIVLSSKERRDIGAAGEIEQEEHFERRTPEGNYAPLKMLKRVAFCSMAVAAIRQGQKNLNGVPGEIIGTGFLVDGADFGCSDDASYILTNAHVMWDPDRGQGLQNTALAPQDAYITFDDEECRDFFRGTIVWQSEVSRMDAALVRLDRKVTHAKPLPLADADTRLVTEDPGTKLAIIGHPEGRELTFAFTGSLEQVQTTLVDMGPKANSPEPAFLHYKTPTEEGNSGSPVFEMENWRVVALHHAGFDAKRGRPKLNGKAGSNFANEGIFVDSIRKAARRQLAPPEPSPQPQLESRKRWSIFRRS